MSGDRAAIAAGLLPGDDLHRALLRSIVDTARAIFRAQAASVFLLDAETDELVFEAVSGEGEESLVGRRFPSSTGIAGWVLVTGQSLVLDDVTADPRFASQAAQSTGYVPKAIMAVPLESGDRTLGVLEVLDRPRGAVHDGRSRPAGDVRNRPLWRSTCSSGHGRAGSQAARPATRAHQLAAARVGGDREAALALLQALERVVSRLG
jgi:GAF domain-containing protein